MQKNIFEQFRTLKILILEDVPEDAELMIRELENSDFVVEAQVVDDEGGFYTALINFRPEIILADYSLPTITGLEALAIAIAEFPDIPFVFVTGTIGEEIAAETILSGASGLVLKSNISRLPEVIKRIFEKNGRWINVRLKFASERVNNRIKTNLKALNRVQQFLNGNRMTIPDDITGDMNETIRDLNNMSNLLSEDH